MVTKELVRLLHEQLDAQGYELIDGYTASLEGLPIESLQIHLEAQRRAAVFCHGKPPGTVLKAINILKAKIADLEKEEGVYESNSCFNDLNH